MVAGCGPPLSDSELGRVVFEVPEVDGDRGPFTLPAATSAIELEQPETAATGSAAGPSD